MFKIISKFLLILELDQKKKLTLLLLLSFVAAILEMLGLSLFIPIVILQIIKQMFFFSIRTT